MSQSPFYSPIRVNQSDFSPITRGAESYGRSVGAGLEKLGDAVGKVASSYFEKKKLDKFSEDFVKSDEAVALWRKKGLNPFDLQEARDDPKKAHKMMGDIVDQAGGVKEFQNKLIESNKFEMLKEQHSISMKLSQTKAEEAEMALNALKIEKNDEEARKLLFAQAFTRDEETGEIKFDIDNLEPSEENRHVLPSVYKQFKEMNLLGNFNYSKWKTNLIRSGAWDASDQQGMSALLDQSMGAYPDIGGEDMRRYKQNLTGDTHKPDVIMKSANEWWNQDPSAKVWMESEETNSKINTGLNNALAQGPDGQYVVKNASTAGFVIRQFARLANGVGVMTNEDVDAVKGASDAQSSWDRLKTRFFGDELQSRQATAEDVKNGWAEKEGEMINVRLGARATAQDLLMIQDATKAFMEVNQRKLQGRGVELQKYLESSYTGVPKERLLQLSPFSEYWHRSHKMDFSDLQVKKISRMIALKGQDATVAALRKSNPDATDRQLSKLINLGSIYEEPPSTGDNVNLRGTNTESPPSPDQTIGTPQEIDNSSRPDMSATDGVGVGDVVEFAAGTTGGMKGLKLLDYMKDSAARGNMLEAMNEPHTRFKQAIKAFRNAPISKVKEFAKEMDVDPSAIKRKLGKGADLRLRETLEKKFKAKIQEKVSASVAKKGLGKKAIGLIMRAAFSGGVGVAAAAFDIIDIFETKNEVAREELNKMLSQHKKGSRERKLIQDMLNTMNYESGDFKKFQNDNPQMQQMGRGNKRQYELYRATTEGI